MGRLAPPAPRAGNAVVLLPVEGALCEPVGTRRVGEGGVRASVRGFLLPTRRTRAHRARAFASRDLASFIAVRLSVRAARAVLDDLAELTLRRRGPEGFLAS